MVYSTQIRLQRLCFSTWTDFIGKGRSLLVFLIILQTMKYSHIHQSISIFYFVLVCSVSFWLNCVSFQSIPCFHGFSHNIIYTFFVAFKNGFPIQSKLLYYSQRLPTVFSVYHHIFICKIKPWVKGNKSNDRKKAPVPTFSSTFIDFPIAYPRLVIAHEPNV